MKAIIKDVICGIVIKTFENVPENEPCERMENVKRNYCRWRKLNPDKFAITLLAE